MKKLNMVFLAALIMGLPVALGGEDAPTLADLEKRISALEDANTTPVFKVGIVSESEVFDNLEQKKDIEVDIELMSKEAEKAIDEMQQGCDNLKTEIESHPEGSDQHKAKTELLGKKTQEMRLRIKELKAIVQRRASMMLDNMRMKIRDHIGRYARKHGYTLVMERNALLYGEEGENLTTEIIDQMNVEYFKLKYGDKKEDEEPSPDDE